MSNVPTYAPNHAYQSLVESLAPGRSDSGALVTVDAALGLAPVWEAVNLISGHVAGMPLNVMRMTGENKEVAQQHPVQRLLNKRPNDWQTPFTFREILMGWALLQGNGRARIIRNGLGQPVELVPLPPWSTYTAIIEGEKYHRTYINPWEPGATQINGNSEIYPDSDVLHIQGFSYNGYWGIHLTQVARNVMGLAISGQERTGATFANQGMPGFLIELPLHIWNNPKKRREFKEEWHATYSGARNAGKMQLVPGGFKAHQAEMTANDQQLREMVELNTEQIRRLFLLPPDSASAYKSITERNTQYLVNCLHRWTSKWEQECYTKLLSERERMADSHFVKFDTAELIKGDPNTWADYTGKLRQQGLINGNEGRQMHGLNAANDEALESYGNPNITTPTDQAMADEIDEEEPIANDIAARAVRLLFSRALETEQRKVRNSAVKAIDDPSWAAEYYKQLKYQLSTICDEVGISTVPAIEHCKEHHGQLMEVRRTEDIELITDTWSNAVDRFMRYV